jgi:tetratricopeptide (TPR) repeat protein
MIENQYIHVKMTILGKIGTIWLLLFLAYNGLYSQDLESQMTKANDAYQAEDYQAAISNYEAILEAGFESANLYYNLGNAWFKQGRIGPSILNYERALELAPGFEDAQANLELAKTRTVDRIVAVPEFLVFRIWRGFRDSFNASQWAIAAIICFWLALASGGLFLFGDKLTLKRTGFIAGILFVFLAVSMCFLAASKYQLELKSPYAIVMEQVVYVKSAPGDTSSDLFILHEGTKIKLVDQLGEWVEIRLADGKKGWIKPEQVVRI